MDMMQTVTPKSDQLNADDLMGGPRTVRITKVAGTGNGDQPVAVSFDGDEGRPYKPCKSMRRVMIAVWGTNAQVYVGRSMTLYRDPAVRFGGMEVGGIRISHMSHMDQPMTLALTATKASRKPYTVKPLVIEEPKPAGPDGWPVLAPDKTIKAAKDGAQWVTWCKAAIGRMSEVADLDEWLLGMGPNFAALEEWGAAEIREVRKVAGDRRAALIEAKMP